MSKELLADVDGAEEREVEVNVMFQLDYLLSGHNYVKEAEEMYQRALQGYDEAWSPDHTLILSTVDNLGSLYYSLGKLEEAEKMYKRARAREEEGTRTRKHLTVPASTRHCLQPLVPLGSSNLVYPSSLCAAAM